jgi:type VI secretion system ImpM family protein
MSLSPATLEVIGFGCFGKLPMSREFIIEESRSLSASGLDRWIGEGIGIAKARLGNRFDRQVSGFPPYRFFWDGGQEHMLAGVMRPSEDGAGRKHPFTLFAHVRGKQRSALATALQVWDLQEQCAALLDPLAAAGTPADAREMVRSARPQLADGGGAVTRYQRFLARRLTKGLWPVPGRPDADGRFTTLQAFAETVQPLAGNRAPAFRGGIRFPLCGAGEEVDLEPCFWLDLTERRLGRPLASAWWLRSPLAATSAGRYLFLFLSPPSRSQWVNLVEPENEVASISYLDRPYGTQPPEQRMAPALRAVLDSAEATFGDCLRWASGD